MADAVDRSDKDEDKDENKDKSESSSLPENQPTVDTILAQVGEDAENVAIGKNIVQKNIRIGRVNIPRRQMMVVTGTLIVIAMAIVGLLGIGGGIFLVVSATATPTLTATITHTATPTATATPTPLPTQTPLPTKMSGVYNIVVAQFAEVDSAGNTVEGGAGWWLSQWLANQLNESLAQVPTLNIQVWHDDLNRPASNPPIGMVDEAGAETLLDDVKNIGADFVVYGQLVHGLVQDTGPPQLQLKFAYKAKSVRKEPDANVGFQRLGSAVPIIGVEEGSYKRRVNDEPELVVRVQLLIQLIEGLSYELDAKYAQALQHFQAAEERLVEAEERLFAGRTLSGGEVVIYFQGREALSLKQFDFAKQAFERALERNPTYASALIGRGNVYFDAVQFYLLSQQGNAGDLAVCAPTLSVSSVISQPLVPQNDEEALAQIEEARSNYQLAIQAIGKEDWPLLPSVLQSMLATMELSLAELGLQGHWGSQPPVNPDETIKQHLQKAEEGFRSALSAFESGEKLDYLAFVRYNLGLIYQARVGLYTKQQKEANRELDQAVIMPYYKQAQAYYQACANQPSPLAESGHQPVEVQIRCYCQYQEQKVLDVIGGSG